MNKDDWKRWQNMNPRPAATGLNLGGTFSLMLDIPMAAIEEIAKVTERGHEVHFAHAETVMSTVTLRAVCPKCKGQVVVKWSRPATTAPVEVTGELASDLTCYAVVLQSLKRGQRVRFFHDGIMMEGYIIGRQKELCKMPLVGNEQCWMVHVDNTKYVNSNWHDQTGTRQPQWMCLATPEDDHLEILADVDD